MAQAERGRGSDGAVGNQRELARVWGKLARVCEELGESCAEQCCESKRETATVWCAGVAGQRRR